MSDYPLDVRSVGDDTYIVMSRGHHDLDEFMREAVKDYPHWKLGGPVQVWCKSVPDRSGRYDTRYCLVEPGTRGAWPATYCYEWGEDWERWNSVEQKAPNLADCGYCPTSGGCVETCMKAPAKKEPSHE